MESIADQQTRENLKKCDINVSEKEFKAIKNRLFYDPEAFDRYFEFWVNEGHHEYNAFHLVHAMYYFIVGKVPYRDFDQYRKSKSYKEFNKVKKLKIQFAPAGNTSQMIENFTNEEKLQLVIDLSTPEGFNKWFEDLYNKFQSTQREAFFMVYELYLMVGGRRPIYGNFKSFIRSRNYRLANKLNRS